MVSEPEAEKCDEVCLDHSHLVTNVWLGPRSLASQFCFVTMLNFFQHVDFGM